MVYFNSLNTIKPITAIAVKLATGEVINITNTYANKVIAIPNNVAKALSILDAL